MLKAKELVCVSHSIPFPSGTPAPEVNWVRGGSATVSLGDMVGSRRGWGVGCSSRCELRAKASCAGQRGSWNWPWTLDGDSREGPFGQENKVSTTLMLECKRGALKGLSSVSQKEQTHRCRGLEASLKILDFIQKTQKACSWKVFLCREGTGLDRALHLSSSGRPV